MLDGAGIQIRILNPIFGSLPKGRKGLQPNAGKRSKPLITERMSASLSGSRSEKLKIQGEPWKTKDDKR
jgi:hypothetical protein